MSVDEKTLKAIQERISAAVISAFEQYVDHMPDMTMIVWKATTGPKGPFEIAEGKANVTNAPFQRLTSFLKAHEGKCQIEGFFVWLFADGSGSIGRKPK